VRSKPEDRKASGLRHFHLYTLEQRAVEQEHLTPLDGARTISAIAATLFGYDEFILREISPEMLLATAPSRR
jgi:hypothetical protein